MVTDFGKFADPLADKLLTTVAFIYMMRDGVCSPVVLCIILALSLIHIYENYRKGLEIINNETGRLYNMVEELLDFSRLQNLSLIHI